MEFVSEEITPGGKSFDTAAMSRGEPGLPSSFHWRGEDYDVRACKDRWKESQHEKGRVSGERYLRRHCYKLHMSDDSVWTVYFTRQPQSSGNIRSRWFLYSID